ncbi:DUF4185 domain-containing protein [Rugosimonospora africana]|uniref:DUF4185 domain-containing protein n=1 Tax=Rugosimonospora africana TaxID=556532 RepID=A0A8J3QR81_9ACTN|nr:DUF4185 domain-containing protein [Rugosimonospora africana]GIH14195.1 hypothetical protein Raf01_23670 [Rugosimonospora africana]
MSPITRRQLMRGAAGVAGAGALGLLGARPAAAAGAAAPAGPASAPALRVLSATPDTPLTGALNAYSDSGTGWTGADSTYTAKLPGGREMFIFSDTFLGPVNPDGSRPLTTPFINNSAVVRTGDRFATVHGGTADAPAALYAPTNPDHWYWMGASLVDGGMLHQILIEFGRTGTGPFDFAWMGTAMASTPTDRLDRPGPIRPLPSSAGITWSAWLQPVGRYLYIYGVEDLSATKYLHVARVPGRDPGAAAWQYWTGAGWSTVEGDSVRVMDGVANEHSVVPWRGRYLLVTQDTTELLSAKIVGYLGDSPTGPFTGKTLLYTTPETGASGSYGNANVYTYNPHVHPEYSDAERLVISYNVNSFDNTDLYSDVSIYRPRFVDARVTLATAGSR